MTYDYLNSIIHLKPLSDLIYYSTNIDLNLHFDNGILIDFSSSDGFNAASRWLRNLNQSMFDRIVTEAKFNQKLNSAAIDEINAQCDALQSIPNAIDNKFLNKFINSNGNYNFYNLKVVHYSSKTNVEDFKKINFGRFIILNEKKIKVDNLIFEFSDTGEFVKAWDD